jgi:hypothetical protein
MDDGDDALGAVIDERALPWPRRERQRDGLAWLSHMLHSKHEEPGAMRLLWDR